MYKIPYRSQCSETAVLTLLQYTFYFGKAVEAPETVIGAFKDIEGAFSNITGNAIDNTMAKKGVPVSVRKWNEGAAKALIVNGREKRYIVFYKKNFNKHTLHFLRFKH